MQLWTFHVSLYFQVPWSKPLMTFGGWYGNKTCPLSSWLPTLPRGDKYVYTTFSVVSGSWILQLSRLLNRYAYFEFVKTFAGIGLTYTCVCMFPSLLFLFVQLKCEKYWPNSSQAQVYGAITVTTVTETVHPSFTIREFLLSVSRKPQNVRIFPSYLTYCYPCTLSLTIPLIVWVECTVSIHDCCLHIDNKFKWVITISLTSHVQI